MLILGILAILILLTLLQLVVLPLNLAFTAVFAFYLFSRRDFSYWWIFALAIIFSLFGSLNPGVVLLAFTLSFLVLELFVRLLPDNSLTKLAFLGAALIVGEGSLIVVQGLVK